MWWRVIEGEGERQDAFHYITLTGHLKETSIFGKLNWDKCQCLPILNTSQWNGCTWTIIIVTCDTKRECTHSSPPLIRTMAPFRRRKNSVSFNTRLALWDKNWSPYSPPQTGPYQTQKTTATVLRTFLSCLNCFQRAFLTMLRLDWCILNSSSTHDKHCNHLERVHLYNIWKSSN